MAWGYGYCGACCTPTPNTTVSGTLFGCTTTGIPGSVVIKNGGTTLWSGSTSGTGAYTSASFFLAATTSLTITGTPTSPRNVAVTITRSIVVGPNTGQNLSAPAASGFICTAVCPLALPTTLTLTSIGLCLGNTFPTDTLTWASGPPAGYGGGGTGAGWFGATPFMLTIGGGHNYLYQFIVNSLGNLGLGAISDTGGVSIFVATPLLTACVPFSCQTICAAQGIGCTIHE